MMLLLVLMFVCAMVACGEKDDDSSSKKGSSRKKDDTEQNVTTPTEDPDPTAEPTDKPEPTAEPVIIDTPTPTEKPADPTPTPVIGGGELSYDLLKGQWSGEKTLEPKEFMSEYMGLAGTGKSHILAHEFFRLKRFLTGPLSLKQIIGKLSAADNRSRCRVSGLLRRRRRIDNYRFSRRLGLVGRLSRRIGILRRGSYILLGIILLTGRTLL